MIEIKMMFFLFFFFTFVAAGDDEGTRPSGFGTFVARKLFYTNFRPSEAWNVPKLLKTDRYLLMSDI